MGYILFVSDDIFSIQARKKWDGIIEYSYDNKEWKEWNGENIINNTIYMRGVNNTVVTQHYEWTIKGNNVKCQGNIENLLDYKSVINNVHPKMGERCFAYMFAKCDSLIESPQLPSVELSIYHRGYGGKKTPTSKEVRRCRKTPCSVGAYKHFRRWGMNFPHFT